MKTLCGGKAANVKSSRLLDILSLGKLHRVTGTALTGTPGYFFAGFLRVAGLGFFVTVGLGGSPK